MGTIQFHNAHFEMTYRLRHHNHANGNIRVIVISFFLFVFETFINMDGLLVQSTLSSRMVMGRANIAAALAISFLLCTMAIVQHVESAGLVYDYYASSCPRAETIIIHDTVYKLYEKKGNIATSLIRFVFHDCFNVRNILLDTPAVPTLPLEVQLFSNHWWYFY